MRSRMSDRGRASRRWSVGIAAALALPVVAAAIAWACSPGARVSLSSATALPGDTVLFSATGFPTDDVRLTWGSESGTLLATQTGPDFTVPVTIPENAKPGTYTILANAHFEGQDYHPAVTVRHPGSATGRPILGVGRQHEPAAGHAAEPEQHTGDRADARVDVARREHAAGVHDASREGAVRHAEGDRRAAPKAHVAARKPVAAAPIDPSVTVRRRRTAPSCAPRPARRCSADRSPTRSARPLRARARRARPQVRRRPRRSRLSTRRSCRARPIRSSTSHSPGPR